MSGFAAAITTTAADATATATVHRISLLQLIGCWQTKEKENDKEKKRRKHQLVIE